MIACLRAMAKKLTWVIDLKEGDLREGEFEGKGVESNGVDRRATLLGRLAG